MNKAIASSFALAALVLGGCASGNLPGGSALPMASQSLLRPSDSVGGGLPGTSPGQGHHAGINPGDSVGGGLPGHDDSVGGGLPGHDDSVGGGLPGHMVKIHNQDSVGGGLPGHKLKVHRQDSVGGGLPGTSAH